MDQNERILKYIAFFIAVFMITKFFAEPTDMIAIQISAFSVVTFCIMDMYFPSIIVENK